MFTYHGWVELRHEQFEKDWIDNEIDYPEYRSRLLAIVSDIEKIADSKFDIQERDLKIIDGTNGMIAIHCIGLS